MSEWLGGEVIYRWCQGGCKIGFHIDGSCKQQSRFIVSRAAVLNLDCFYGDRMYFQ